MGGARMKVGGRPRKRATEAAARAAASASEISRPSAAESPLLWMARRKDKSGETMIGPAAFAAGERLRADLTFSGMLPRVTMDWSGRMPGAKGGDAISLNPTEAGIAARQRVDKALREVGPEFSGLLVDLCGFAKGLELIELERGWPARSAKVVVRLALASLARHYGYGDTSTGRERGVMRSWQGPDARPRMTNAPFESARSC